MVSSRSLNKSEQQQQGHSEPPNTNYISSLEDQTTFLLTGYTNGNLRCGKLFFLDQNFESLILLSHDDSLSIKFLYSFPLSL